MFRGDLGTQHADFRFRMDFAEYMVTNEKVYFVFVDGASSGSSGNQLLYAVAKEPGRWEIKDIEKVLK